MKKHSLLELNHFLKRAITANLPEALWISCEISQSGLSRGHRYLEVIQKDDVSNQILAQSSAMLWSKQYQAIKKAKGTIIDEVLRTGTAVLLQVRVEFNERYGLKLVIQDLDTTYTLGALALKRQEMIQRLQQEGLTILNKQLPLPAVLQRIAIISSDSAAGYHDFINQLSSNEYGYHFEYQLFSAAMQGENTEREVLEAFRQIGKKAASFDAIVIIRGGGSKLDLAAFDNFAISKTIATAPLPVLTGIGHEIDETVTDLVAHTMLKTPTAAAAFLIDHNLYFENKLLQSFSFIIQQTQQTIQIQNLDLQQIKNKFNYEVNSFLKNEQTQLQLLDGQLPKIMLQQFKNQQQQLTFIEKNINLLNPEYALKRGFSLTLKNGNIVRSAQDLKEGDEITTVFKDGKKTSIVNE